MERRMISHTVHVFMRCVHSHNIRWTNEEMRVMRLVAFVLLLFCLCIVNEWAFSFEVRMLFWVICLSLSLSCWIVSFHFDLFLEPCLSPFIWVFDFFSVSWLVYFFFVNFFLAWVRLAYMWSMSVAFLSGYTSFHEHNNCIFLIIFIYNNSHNNNNHHSNTSLFWMERTCFYVWTVLCTSCFFNQTHNHHNRSKRNQGRKCTSEEYRYRYKRRKWQKYRTTKYNTKYRGERKYNREKHKCRNTTTLLLFLFVFSMYSSLFALSCMCYLSLVSSSSCMAHTHTHTN